jgi:multidrug efflux pump subunit AcrA (membrane-fusion protein)
MDKKRKRAALIAAAAIVGASALIGSGALFLSSRAGAAMASAYKSAAAESGSVESSLRASGKLARAAFDATLPYGVAVEGVYAEKGDALRRGDRVASLRASSVTEAISDVKSEIEGVDEDMEAARKGKTEEVSVRSRSSGRVKAVYAKEGDSAEDVAAQFGALAVLSLDGTMSFSFQTDADLLLGGELTVRLSGGEEAEGSVASLLNRQYTVTVSDSGPKIGESAQAFLDGKMVGEGKLAVTSPLLILNDRGTVSHVYAAENQRVGNGERLFDLSLPSTDKSYLSLKERKADLLEQLEALNALSGDPSLYAPESGELSELFISKGRALEREAGQSSGKAFTISSSQSMAIAVAVDELDIAAVKPGSHARVSIDAIPRQIFEGKTIEVADEPDPATSRYPATVLIPLEGDMRPGMSASVEIPHKKAEGLLIPLAAVQEYGERTYVYTALDRKGLSGEKDIQTGVSDGEVVAVEGLAEGDAVYYRAESGGGGMPFGFGGGGAGD